jgi:hypothetical protein
MMPCWHVGRARTIPAQKAYKLENITQQRAQHCTLLCHMLREHNISVVSKDNSTITEN